MVEIIRKETADRVKRFTGYDVPSVDIYITKLIRYEKERSTEEDGEKPADND